MATYRGRGPGSARQARSQSPWRTGQLTLEDRGRCRDRRHRNRFPSIWSGSSTSLRDRSCQTGRFRQGTCPSHWHVHRQSGKLEPRSASRRGARVNRQRHAVRERNVVQSEAKGLTQTTIRLVFRDSADATRSQESVLRQGPPGCRSITGCAIPVKADSGDD